MSNHADTNYQCCAQKRNIKQITYAMYRAFYFTRAATNSEWNGPHKLPESSSSKYMFSASFALNLPFKPFDSPAITIASSPLSGVCGFKY